MKKTIISGLLCLFTCVFSLCLSSCTSSDEDSLDSFSSDCTVIINNEDYYADDLYSHFTHKTTNDDSFGYNDRPLFSYYELFAFPKDERKKYIEEINIDIHVADVGKGFVFTKDNTTLSCNKYPEAPVYLMSSGSAKVISFSTNSCTTEFNNCVFKNVENDKEIKINGKTTLRVRII